MFSKEKNPNEIEKIAALLIHAAKIDENYSDDEEKIIKKTLLEIGANNQNIENIIMNAKATIRIIFFTSKRTFNI